MRVKVRITDRGFVGPSGGLIYALAVYDLLTGRGPPAGVVIAATGELTPMGTVQAVGWVNLKSASAFRAGATRLLVPLGEQSSSLKSGRHLGWVQVGSLTSAIGAQQGR